MRFGWGASAADADAPPAGVEDRQAPSAGGDKQLESQEVTKAVENARAFNLAKAEFQANMQMFKTFSELAATSIKTVGEGMATLARKQ